MLAMSQSMLDAAFKWSFSVPDNVPVDIVDQCKATEEDVLKECRSLVTNQDEATDASARCMLAVSHAVKLHKDRSPHDELYREHGLDKRSKKASSGLVVDEVSACSQRIRATIAEVQCNKSVAISLLPFSSGPVSVAAPVRFAEEKYQNLKGFRKKRVQISRGRAPKGNTTQAPMRSAEMTNSGGKGDLDSAEAKAGAEAGMGHSCGAGNLTADKGAVEKSKGVHDEGPTVGPSAFLKHKWID